MVCLVLGNFGCTESFDAFISILFEVFGAGGVRREFQAQSLPFSRDMIHALWQLSDCLKDIRCLNVNSLVGLQDGQTSFQNGSM